MRNRPSAFRYALAALAVFAALLLRELLSPLLGSHDPYETVWLALVFSAWYCGLGPSILATLLGTVGVWYLFLPPRHSLILQDRADIYGMLGFLLFSAAIIGLGESNRRGLAARSQAEEAIKEKEFSARLLNAQDEERRRIARELHDGVGQLLAAISLKFASVQMERTKLSPEAARCLDENATLIRQVSADIRTTAYLMHPPLLDEMGLVSALKWFVDGFSERSKIAAKLDVPKDWDQLPQDYELCLFRIAQECLTNIHRHSGGSTARLRLSHSPGEIELDVSDDGKGIDSEAQSKIVSGKTVGVGLRGMRERVGQLGGRVEIRSNGTGTTVKVMVPFEKSERRVATSSSDELLDRNVATLRENASSRAARA